MKSFIICLLLAAPLLSRAQGVGIGTTTPTAALEVAAPSNGVGLLRSSSRIGAWLRLDNASPGGGGWSLISTGADNGEGPGKLLLLPSALGAGYSTTNVLPLALLRNGRVGIGTADPLATLHVAGPGATLRVDGLAGAPAPGQLLGVDPSGQLAGIGIPSISSANGQLSLSILGQTQTIALATTGDNLGSGVATANVNLNGNLLVGGTAASPGTLGLSVSGTGQVGIGTTAPTQALDVGGNLRVRGLSGSESRLPVVLPDGTLGINPPVYTTPGNTSSVQPLGSPPLEMVPTGIAVAGGRAYVADNSLTPQLRLYDVSAPGSAPALLSSTGIAESPMAIALSGNRVYLVTIGLLLTYDVSGATPSLLSSVSLWIGPPGSTRGRNLAVRGTRAYVVNAPWLQVYDISSPTPVLLGQVQEPAFDPNNADPSYQLALSGNRAYVAGAGINKFLVFDISTDSPSRIGLASAGPSPGPPFPGAYSLAVSGTTVYLANSQSDQLEVYDAATAAAPVLVTTTTTVNRPLCAFNDVTLSGTTLYLNDYHNNAVQVVDVSGPAPVLTGRLALLPGVGLNLPFALAENGGRVFVGTRAFNSGSRLQVLSPRPSRTVVVNGDGSLGSVPTPALSLAGQSLSLSGGNAVTLPTQSLSLSGQSLTISSGNTVALPPGADNLGNHTATQNLGLAGFQLLNAGRVGIGTSAPAFPLDVSGAANVSGSAFVGGPVGIGTAAPGQLLEAGATTRAQPAFLRLSGGNGTAFRQWDMGLTLNPASPGDAMGENYDFALRDATTNATRLLVEWNTGNVGLGTSAPAAKLDVAGTVRCVALTQTSDQRLKQQVRPLTGALAGVLALRPRRYRWNAAGVRRGGAAGAEQIGLLAQEVAAVYPELVATAPDGYQSVNYAQLAPVLVGAVQELQRQLDQARTQAATAQADASAAQAATAALLRRLETLEAQAPQARR